MKTSNSLLTEANNQPHSKCESSSEGTLILLVLHCYSLLLQGLILVKTKVRSLSLKFVRSVAHVIQHVYLFLRVDLFQNKRHLAGSVMLVAGVLGIYSGLFFDSFNINHAPCELFGLTSQCFNFETKSGWCFMNWYYYMDSVDVYIALLFWSVAVVLFIPPKYSLSFIPASLVHAMGWLKILHITFFARSYETYHAFPEWEIIVIALCLGFSIVMSADFLLYWENHKKRGNWQKWPAIYRSSYSQEEKNRMYEIADKEYNEVNRMI